MIFFNHTDLNLCKSVKLFFSSIHKCKMSMDKRIFTYNVHAYFVLKKLLINLFTCLFLINEINYCLDISL